MRPAVNVGLSVSRVGGAAQTKSNEKASGTIRIDLAQYREMEVFTQFSSDLDDTTKEQLQYGKGLMELLKQPLCHPMSLGRPGHHTGGSKQASAFGCGDSKDQGIPAWNA